jgi:hypothetical protein
MFLMGLGVVCSICYDGDAIYDEVEETAFRAYIISNQVEQGWTQKTAFISEGRRSGAGYGGQR